jgi:hypothetical protein
VTTVTILQAVFAAGAVVVAASITVTLFRPLPRQLLVWFAAFLGAAAAAGWALFALDPGSARGVAATGLSLCAIAEIGAVVLAEALTRRRRVEEEIVQAEARLSALITTESEQRSAELARTLVRARADASSLLVEEERKIAAERHKLLAEREQQARGELAEALAQAQQRVEHRLAEWSADLDQIQQTLKIEAARLAERQKQLVADAHQRIEADARRLDATSEEQRAAVIKLRAELAQAADGAIAAAKAELEEHAAERRRALHEVSERLRRRERELREQIEHEESEAVERIKGNFGDIERRQLDKLARTVDRAGVRYAEAAEQQFEAAIRAARENAASRLARELERATAMFVREAESVLAEQLARVGDTGALRLEKRLAETEAGLNRRREEILAALEQRLSEAESELRRRLESLEADTEAERGVLEARLHELSRQIDETLGAAELSARGAIRTR